MINVPLWIKWPFFLSCGHAGTGRKKGVQSAGDSTAKRGKITHACASGVFSCCALETNKEVCEGDKRAVL